MENLTDSNSEPIRLELNNNGIKQLNTTRKWTLFISIFGFVFIGLMIIIASLIAVNSHLSSNSSAISLLPLLIMSTIYFFPIYLLFQFSSSSKKAIRDNDSIQLSKALRYLKSHYLFMGILMIVVTGIYFIVGVTTVITGNLLSTLLN